MSDSNYVEGKWSFSKRSFSTLKVCPYVTDLKLVMFELSYLFQKWHADFSNSGVIWKVQQIITIKSVYPFIDLYWFLISGNSGYTNNHFF